jgi:hypothetical protein
LQQTAARPAAASAASARGGSKRQARRLV